MKKIIQLGIFCVLNKFIFSTQNQCNTFNVEAFTYTCMNNNKIKTVTKLPNNAFLELNKIILERQTKMNKLIDSVICNKDLKNHYFQILNSYIDFHFLTEEEFYIMYHIARRLENINISKVFENSYEEKDYQNNCHKFSLNLPKKITTIDKSYLKYDEFINIRDQDNQSNRQSNIEKVGVKRKISQLDYESESDSINEITNNSFKSLTCLNHIKYNERLPIKQKAVKYFGCNTKNAIETMKEFLFNKFKYETVMKNNHTIYQNKFMEDFIDEFPKRNIQKNIKNSDFFILESNEIKKEINSFKDVKKNSLPRQFNIYSSYLKAFDITDIKTYHFKNFEIIYKNKKKLTENCKEISISFFISCFFVLNFSIKSLNFICDESLNKDLETFTNDVKENKYFMVLANEEMNSLIEYLTNFNNFNNIYEIKKLHGIVMLYKIACMINIGYYNDIFKQKKLNYSELKIKFILTAIDDHINGTRNSIDKIYNNH